MDFRLEGVNFHSDGVETEQEGGEIEYEGVDIQLEGVEIDWEGVDLRTALKMFKTAKQRATVANHTSVGKELHTRFYRRNCKSNWTLLSDVQLQGEIRTSCGN